MFENYLKICRFSISDQAPIKLDRVAPIFQIDVDDKSILHDPRADELCQKNMLSGN